MNHQEMIRQKPVKKASNKIKERKELQSILAERRSRGQVIVFTNGCFDLIHPGHVSYLEEARSWGDCLVVAINSDESVKRLKGPERPILDERSRCEVIAGLHCVDYVTTFHEDTPKEIIDELLPNVLVKGGDWAKDRIVGRETVEKHGGTVMNIAFQEGFSTSSIISKIEQSLQKRNS